MSKGEERRLEMADNIEVAQNHGRVLDKILYKLGVQRGTIGALRRKARWVSDGTPVVDAGSHTTYPVATADLVYDHTNEYAYICTVAPTASTDATFVKLHA
jgi:hypothetical protein